MSKRLPDFEDEPETSPEPAPKMNGSKPGRGTILPRPPVPLDADMAGFDMPVDTQRIMDSDLMACGDDAAIVAAHRLWYRAWRQIPASSMPDNDRQIAFMAGYPSGGKMWRRIRERALKGFVKCSDGRLYHLVIADYVFNTLTRKKRQSRRAQMRWDRTKYLEDIENDESRGNAVVDAVVDAVAMPREGDGDKDKKESSLNGSKDLNGSSPAQKANGHSPPAQHDGREPMTTEQIVETARLILVEVGHTLNIDVTWYNSPHHVLGEAIKAGFTFNDFADAAAHYQDNHPNEINRGNVNSTLKTLVNHCWQCRKANEPIYLTGTQKIQQDNRINILARCFEDFPAGTILPRHKPFRTMDDSGQGAYPGAPGSLYTRKEALEALASVGAHWDGTKEGLVVRRETQAGPRNKSSP